MNRQGAATLAKLKKKKVVEKKADSHETVSAADNLRYAGFWQHVRHGVQVHNHKVQGHHLNAHRFISDPSEV